jgi:hypothetical protein
MTTENIFSAVLTLSLMVGGAVAFGSDAAQTPKAPAKVATATVTLPEVTVVGRRVAEADQVTLPAVTVVGRRIAPTTVVVELPVVTIVGRRAPNTVAVETQSVEQRVQ